MEKTKYQTKARLYTGRQSSITIPLRAKITIPGQGSTVYTLDQEDIIVEKAVFDSPLVSGKIPVTTDNTKDIYYEVRNSNYILHLPILEEQLFYYFGTVIWLKNVPFAISITIDAYPDRPDLPYDVTLDPAYIETVGDGGGGDISSKQDKIDPDINTQTHSVVDAINNLIADKQDADDNNLQTTSKTVVGAINEVNDNNLALESDPWLVYNNNNVYTFSCLKKNLSNLTVSEFGTYIYEHLDEYYEKGNYPTLFQSTENAAPHIGGDIYTCTHAERSVNDNLVTIYIRFLNKTGVAITTGYDMRITYNTNDPQSSTFSFDSLTPIALQRTTDDNLATTSKNVVGAINEVNQKIDNLQNFDIHLCTSEEYDEHGVPTIQNPDTKTIYLVPNSLETHNLFTEWIYVNNAWEKFGDVDVDISGKQDKTDNSLETTSKTVVGAINEVKTNTDLKQPITDNSLTTTSKTVVGAINELKATVTQPNIILYGVGPFITEGCDNVKNNFTWKTYTGETIQFDNIHSFIRQEFINRQFIDPTPNWQIQQPLYICLSGTQDNYPETNLLFRIRTFTFGNTGGHQDFFVAESNHVEIAMKANLTYTLAYDPLTLPNGAIFYNIMGRSVVVADALPTPIERYYTNHVTLLVGETIYQCVKNGSQYRWEEIRKITSPIINVTTLPTTNIQNNAFYRLSSAPSVLYHYNGTAWETVQNASDNTLTTTSKTIVGAINEINAKPSGSNSQLWVATQENDTYTFSCEEAGQSNLTVKQFGAFLYQHFNDYSGKEILLTQTPEAGADQIFTYKSSMLFKDSASTLATEETLSTGFEMSYSALQKTDAGYSVPPAGYQSKFFLIYDANDDNNCLFTGLPALVPQRGMWEIRPNASTPDDLATATFYSADRYCTLTFQQFVNDFIENADIYSKYPPIISMAGTYFNAWAIIITKQGGKDYCQIMYSNATSGLGFSGSNNAAVVIYITKMWNSTTEQYDYSSIVNTTYLQSTEDNTLTTTDKTIVGAINELNEPDINTNVTTNVDDCYFPVTQQRAQKTVSDSRSFLASMTDPISNTSINGTCVTEERNYAQFLAITQTFSQHTTRNNSTVVFRRQGFAEFSTAEGAWETPDITWKDWYPVEYPLTALTLNSGWTGTVNFSVTGGILNVYFSALVRGQDAATPPRPIDPSNNVVNLTIKNDNVVGAIIDYTTNNVIRIRWANADGIICNSNMVVGTAYYGTINIPLGY